MDSRVTRYAALLAGNGAILLTAAQRGPQAIDYTEVEYLHDLFLEEIGIHLT